MYKLPQSTMRTRTAESKKELTKRMKESSLLKVKCKRYIKHIYFLILSYQKKFRLLVKTE